MTGIINSYSLPFSDEFSQIRNFSARMQEQAVPVKIIQIFLENADMLKKNVSKIDKIARFSTEDNLKKFKKIKHFSEDVLPKVDKPKAEEVSAILNSDKLFLKST